MTEFREGQLVLIKHSETGHMELKQFDDFNIALMNVVKKIRTSASYASPRLPTETELRELVPQVYEQIDMPRFIDPADKLPAEKQAVLVIREENGRIPEFMVFGSGKFWQGENMPAFDPEQVLNWFPYPS